MNRLKVTIHCGASRYREVFKDPAPVIFSMARLPNGEKRGARVYFDEGNSEFGERQGRLMFPGDFDGPKGSPDLKPGDKVDLMAGDEVVLTCFVVNE